MNPPPDDLMSRHEPVPGAGEPAARQGFLELYEQHADSLWAFVRSRVGPAQAAHAEASDVFQEIWLRAWEHLDYFHGGNFRAWLFQIARNYCFDLRRKKAAVRLADEEGLVDTRPLDPLENLIERERIEALSRCLERLAKSAADLVRARLGGKSYEEIERELGLQPARAQKLFFNAKAQLSACVERTLR
jgi:RNA polymerase sigma-70 factor (ECF subfamily)